MIRGKEIWNEWACPKKKQAKTLLTNEENNKKMNTTIMKNFKNKIDMISGLKKYSNAAIENNKEKIQNSEVLHQKIIQENKRPQSAYFPMSVRNDYSKIKREDYQSKITEKSKLLNESGSFIKQELGIKKNITPKNNKIDNLKILRNFPIEVFHKNNVKGGINNFYLLQNNNKRMENKRKLSMPLVDKKKRDVKMQIPIKIFNFESAKPVLIQRRFEE